MKCCRVSRYWPSEQWKMTYESFCFQQAEEYISDTCQHLQTEVLVFQSEEKVNFFFCDFCPLRPLRHKINVIKYKAKTWLCLSSGWRFLSWREVTVPGDQSWCQWWRGFSQAWITEWNHRFSSSSQTQQIMQSLCSLLLAINSLQMTTQVQAQAYSFPYKENSLWLSLVKTAVNGGILFTSCLSKCTEVLATKCI